MNVIVIGASLSQQKLSGPMAAVILAGIGGVALGWAFQWGYGALAVQLAVVAALWWLERRRRTAKAREAGGA